MRESGDRRRLRPFVALRIMIEAMLKAKEDLLFRRRQGKNLSEVPKKLRWQA